MGKIVNNNFNTTFCIDKIMGITGKPVTKKMGKERTDVFYGGDIFCGYAGNGNKQCTAYKK